MGKLKKRIHPRDITINIGKDAPIPECPIPGERYYSTYSFWKVNFNNKRILLIRLSYVTFAAGKK
jgi:DNA topoisomerase-1